LARALVLASDFRKGGKHPSAARVAEQENVMHIDKSQILELLRKQGDNDKAAQAESELPDQVDTDQHSDLLSRLGINPAELLGKLPGGLGDKLGGLGL
jgi:hypothetical protein